jgi:hypothetical protein
MGARPEISRKGKGLIIGQNFRQLRKKGAREK